MILVDATDLTMARPGRDLFRDVSVTISTGDRIGLVGLNGTGKSTLIDVLIGNREPESGTVRRGRDVQIATLDQNPDLGTGTVRDAVDHVDGESWEIDAVLGKLGMGGRSDTPVSQLSGGEAKRVALARALVHPSDLLILDEPTNHLDVDAIEWLEARLSSYKGGLILVTHDRHVLDRVTNRVVELDRGNAFTHEGGYDAYLEGRALREAQAVQAEKVRANLAKTELAWLRRGAPARTSKAKARIRSATEIVNTRPDAPARDGSLDLHFGTPRLGNDVVELRGVSFAHPDHDPLFSSVDLAIDPRERLGIVGSNGTGKSTLLDVIAGKRQPTQGGVEIGSTVVMELFDQRGIELNPQSRVWEAIVDAPKPEWQDIALMESFWFDSDAQYAPIELLSGGERRRLQLLITLAKKPNVLLLDEPTNDLDLDTLRVLEDFLENYPGAVIVVSHDRAFLERTVDDVIVFDGGGTVGRLPGGYEAYDELRRSKQGSKADSTAASSGAKKTSTAVAAKKSGGRSHSTVRHELKANEKEMAKLDKRQTALTAELEAAGTDHDALARIGGQLGEVTNRIEDLEEQWLVLSEELER